MIFVSSNCSKKNNIRDAVLDLVDYGIKNIELSGGTNFYTNYLEDLQELRQRYNLNYRLHNYFPPPEKHFVLNLASASEFILKQSREMVKKAIDLSVLFDSKRYGLHAGFRMSPRADELGHKIQNMALLPYAETLNKFASVVAELNAYAKEKGIQLYLENNVFSKENAESYRFENPFFLTSSDEYFDLKNKCAFSLLLDVAHLKVSSQTHKLDFADEFHKLIVESDYIHISSNDGTKDSNQEMNSTSIIYQFLKEVSLKNKTFTVEVYDGLEAVHRTIDLLHGLL